MVIYYWKIKKPYKYLQWMMVRGRGLARQLPIRFFFIEKEWCYLFLSTLLIAIPGGVRLDVLLSIIIIFIIIVIISIIHIHNHIIVIVIITMMMTLMIIIIIIFNFFICYVLWALRMCFVCLILSLLINEI